MTRRAHLHAALIALATLGGAALPATASPPRPQPQQAPPQPRAPQPVDAKVINAQSSGSDTHVTLAVASGHPVQVGWRGQLFDASGKPMAGGAFTVHTVRKRQVVGTVVGQSPQAVTGATAVLSPP